MLLAELQNPVNELPGIGKATSGTLAGIGVRTVADLLRHQPRDYEDRQKTIGFSGIRGEGIANTTITVVEHDSFYWRNGQTLKVIVTDGSEPASLLCYGRNFLARTLTPGEDFRIYGRFLRRRGELQSASFTVESLGTPGGEFDKILPVYPLSGKLTQRVLRRAVSASIEEYLDELEEEIPETIRDAHGLLAMGKAIRAIHYPETIDGAEEARRTLAFGELFYLQLIMRRRSRANRSPRKVSRTFDPSLVPKIIARLDFDLTRDQASCVLEIEHDLAGAEPMMRLLQGDVGCGKTLVALLASALVANSGEQAAFMAPTELLARQQAESAARLLEPVGMRVGLLTGNVTGAARNHLLGAIKAGEIDVIVGTHALFSGDVGFGSLGLVVIDEQHRFGVLQRLAIVEKGVRPDLLLMTATPIPRSLALTVFGDLDTSTIKTMPKGRLPVRTHLALRGKESKVYERVRRELAAGHQAYFVYPLISQSAALEVKDAEGMFQELSTNVFPNRSLGLIHSRVSEEEKLLRMDAFARGELEILVATSVVEVGVDVPNATCMVIEHAERFGLSALHQLRGRVGRSDAQSYAFLIYDSAGTELAKRRLMVMKETSDGFAIAEEDLKMRGPGELTGTQQTGDLELRFADLIEDFDLLTESREDVLSLLERDNGLLLPENTPIREVLSRSPPFSDSTTQAG